jgi:cell envelope integrity inner membrane protein tolA
MMNIVETQYKEITSLQDRETEQLTIEVNTIYQQMEAIGNIGLQLAAEAGERLIEIKGRLAHGEFESWCKDNLTFSKRKAENMMRWSQKCKDENSIFSKTQTFTDLGISKVWALLAAPEEVAEEVLKEGASDMSVRELQDEISRLKSEKKTAQEYARASEEEQANMEEEIEILKRQLEEARRESEEENSQSTSEAEEEIEQLKKKLEAAETNLQKTKEKLKTEKNSSDKKIEEAISKAKAEAQKEAEAKTSKSLEDITKKYEESQSVINKLQTALANSENKALAIFKVKSDLLQESFNSCLASIEDVAAEDQEKGDKMKAALRQIMSNQIERL